MIRRPVAFESWAGKQRVSVMARIHGLLVIATLLAMSVFIPSTAKAADAKCEPDKLASKYPSLAGKTFKIGTDGETPPYAMRDPKDFNHLIGLDTELAEAAFKCLGVPIEFKLGAWSGQLPAVANGQTDAMWDTLYYTPERAQQMDFVIYSRAATGGMVQKGNPKHIMSLDDVCGVRAAAGLATVEEAQFRQLSEKCVKDGKKAIDIVTFPDIPAGARLVMNDRADLLLINLGLVDQFVADNPDKAERAFMIVTNWKIGVGFNKSNKDLEQAVADALSAVRASGAEKSIYEKYHFDYSLAMPIEILTQ
jgi:polar amino acid transport system substrate-binding protein